MNNIIKFQVKFLQADGHRLALSRVFSGTLKEGATLFARSARSDKVQKVGQERAHSRQDGLERARGGGVREKGGASCNIRCVNKGDWQLR